VLHHDLQLGRTTSLQGRRTADIDSGTWKEVRMKDRQGRLTAEKAPFLRDVAEAASRTADKVLNVEIKQGYADCGAAEQAASTLASSLPGGQWFLTSVDRRHLRCARQVDPNGYLGQIVLDAQALALGSDNRLARTNAARLRAPVIDQAWLRQFQADVGGGPAGIHIDINTLQRNPGLLALSREMNVPRVHLLPRLGQGPCPGPGRRPQAGRPAAQRRHHQRPAGRFLPRPQHPMSDTLPEAGGKIRALVAAHIEPVTRFDAADLNEVSPEQTYPVALELTVNQQVSFAIGRQAGAARLPGGIEKVGGKPAFEAELGQRLTRANTEVPTAVQNWAQANPGSYRRLMSPSAGFLRQPGTIGYEHTCTTCAGACRVTCPTCFGKGRTTCLGCHGAGKLNCHRCHGSKKLSCSSCNGRGSWSEQVSESTWSHATNSYVTSYRTEYRSCIACSSSGHTSCHSCGYDGKVPCSPCGGQGHVNCMRCNTTGKVNCSACVASGIQHVRGTIEARVTHTEQLGIATEPGRLHDLIGTLPRESLPDFGALTQVQHTPQGRTLQTRHTLRLDVREARLQAGQEAFTLYGFGPQAQVLSFENIAGHLLTDDLKKLEARVARTSRWRRQRGGDLLETIADFLRSELNLLIAEKVADRSGSSDAATQDVEAHFSGLVDATYIGRSTSALRGALTRLYGSELLEPAASLCGLVALAAAIQYGFGFHDGSAWLTVLASMAVGAVAWVVLEWMTQRRIARHFQADFGKRVMQQLGEDGSVKRWRVGMAAALPTVALLAVMATGALPPGARAPPGAGLRPPRPESGFERLHGLRPQPRRAAEEIPLARPCGGAGRTRRSTRQAHRRLAAVAGGRGGERRGRSSQVAGAGHAPGAQRRFVENGQGRADPEPGRHARRPARRRATLAGSHQAKQRGSPLLAGPLVPARTKPFARPATRPAIAYTGGRPQTRARRLAAR